MFANFTNLDYMILVLSGFFVLGSALRGFLKEVISLTILVVSILSSYYFGSYVKSMLTSYSSLDFLNSVLSFGLVFLLTLLLLHRIFSLLFLSVKLDPKIDFILGLSFGILKSIVLGYLFFIVLDSFVPVEEQPDFSKYSNFRGYFYQAKDQLMGVNSGSIFK